MTLTYSTLSGAKGTAGSIKYLVNYDKISATLCITLAEAWLAARLRIPRMKERTTVAIALDDDNVTLPTGFLAAEILYLRGSGALELIADFDMDARRGIEADGTLAAGEPAYWMWLGEPAKAYFDVKADKAYTGDLTYYKKPTALSGSNDTNLYTARTTAALHHACLGFAYEQMKMVAEAAGEFAAASAEVNRENIMGEMGMRGMLVDHRAS